MTDARASADRLARLLSAERSCLADFLAALADFDREHGWRALGHTSLFEFVRRELRLSKAATYARTTAARLVQEYPAVLEAVREGKLCLTNIGPLARVVTPDNVADVLPRFFCISKDEAEAIAAGLAPATAPPRRELVTALTLPCKVEGAAAAAARPTAAPLLQVNSVRLDEPLLVNTTSPSGGAARAVPPAHERDVVEMLTPDLRRWHVTVSKTFLAKLESAKDAVSHSIPDGNTEAVLSAGIDLLLEKVAKQRGLVKRPRPTLAANDTEKPAGAGAGASSPPEPPAEERDADHVPAAVRRAAFERAGCACEWTLPDGQRCGSTWQLQLDHVIPRARGGPSTIENVRVLCRAHKVRAARLAFGDPWMDRFAPATA